MKKLKWIPVALLLALVFCLPCLAEGTEAPLAVDTAALKERGECFTGLLPGAVMDRFAFDEVNRRLVVVPTDTAGDRTRIVYPELGRHYAAARDQRPEAVVWSVERSKLQRL